MYYCPICDLQVQELQERCGRCACDLSAIARLHEVPNAQFNAALAAALGGDETTALRQLGALLFTRSNDVDAWYLQGLLHARRGNVDDANRSWRRVLSLQSDHAAARQAMARLSELTAVEANASATAKNEATRSATESPRSGLM